MSICTKNGCISWSTRSSSMGGCRPFLCNFVGEWKAQLKERWKIHKKTAFFECSRMCNFFITMLLERKIGIYTNHNRLYLWSHFQRYSHTCIEDIYTNLVKSSVSPYILISTHLYLLCRDDSRAEISREEHGHIYVRVYKISGAFIPRHRRYAYASDHKTLYFPCFLCVFSTSPPTVPSTKPSNCAKMAYNLLSNMILYFIKCTHFSYRYSYMSNIHHHNFSYDLIYSLIPFDHPFSKCGHLNVTHYGIKIYVNGWYSKSYIHI